MRSKRITSATYAQQEQFYPAERLQQLFSEETIGHKLRGSEFKVLANLYWHCDSVKLISWPSQDRIATETCLCRETVNRAIKSLAAKGLISIRDKRKRGRSWAHNVYALQPGMMSKVKRERQAWRASEAYRTPTRAHVNVTPRSHYQKTQVIKEVGTGIQTPIIDITEKDDRERGYRIVHVPGYGDILMEM